MALPIIVYSLFNNVFMLEDALRHQRLFGTGTRQLELGEDELERLRGN